MPVPVDEIPCLIDRMLLIGPPGIGKTERVRDLAEEEARKMGRIFVDIRRDLKLRPELFKDIVRNPSRYYLYWRIVAPHVFPEDLNYPVKEVEDILRYVVHIAPREVSLFTLKDIAGVIFIDEITNIPRRDQESMYFSWINEKELGWSLQLSDMVKIVCAGNPPEVSSTASLLSAALLSRMIKIEVAPSKPEGWIDYMNRKYGDRWEKKTGAFVMVFKDSLYKPPKEASTLEPFPTPRSWTRLALMLKNELSNVPEKFRDEVILGTVGKEVGAKFIAFYKKPVPKPREVLEKPEILKNLDFETQYLAMATVAENIELLITKGEKLFSFLDGFNRELTVLLYHLTPEKHRMELINRFGIYITRAVAEGAKYY